MARVINMIWAEEAGIKIVIRESEGRPDRRVIEIVRDDAVDTILASATIAKHNRNRVADAFIQHVSAGLGDS